MPGRARYCAVMDTQSPWIAIVDDEAAIRRALLRLLRSAGLPARAYAGGAELQADLRGATDLPFCAVLDLHMPGMSGFEIQAWLAGAAPQVRVIFATGQHSPDTHARAWQCEPVAYLLKPMDEQLLLDAVAAALAEWTAKHNNKETP